MPTAAMPTRSNSKGERAKMSVILISTLMVYLINMVYGLRLQRYGISARRGIENRTGTLHFSKSFLQTGAKTLQIVHGVQERAENFAICIIGVLQTEIRGTGP